MSACVGEKCIDIVEMLVRVRAEKEIELATNLAHRREEIFGGDHAVHFARNQIRTFRLLLLHVPSGGDADGEQQQAQRGHRQGDLQQQPRIKHSVKKSRQKSFRAAGILPRQSSSKSWLPVSRFFVEFFARRYVPRSESTPARETPEFVRG